MQAKKTIFSAISFLFLANLVATTSVAQSRTDSTIPPKFSTSDSAKDIAWSRQSVIIGLRNGEFLRAHLIGVDPVDADSILVESDGRHRSIKLDSVQEIRPQPRKFDEYWNVARNDEKARLDNLAIELQNNPGQTAYIISYGPCKGFGRASADQAQDYLVTGRGLDTSRVSAREGGCRSEPFTQIWLVPPGGVAPPIADTVACKACGRKASAGRKKSSKRRHHILSKLGIGGEPSFMKR